MIEIVVYKGSVPYITEIVCSGSIFIDWRKKTIAWGRNFTFSKINMVRNGNILGRIEVLVEENENEQSV